MGPADTADLCGSHFPLRRVVTVVNHLQHEGGGGGGGGWHVKNDEEAIQCRARLIIHPGGISHTSCGGASLPQERPIMTAVTAWKRLFIPLKSDLMLPSVSLQSCQESHRSKTRGEKL